MTVTNLALGQSINMAATFNTKLEAPILQTEMGLNAIATATGQAVRWNEFTLKHNNDGSFKTGVIIATDISNQKLFNKSSSANPSATINTNGTQIDLLPATGYSAIVPLGMNIVFSGTFGSETATAQVIATYSDTTTATLSKPAVGAGTATLSTTDFLTLFKDGVYINKLSVVTKSTIASSAVLVSYNHYGHYM